MKTLLRNIYLPIEDLTGVIDGYRIRFDPLFEKCPAHVALVFPFQNEVGEERISETIRLVCDNRLSFSLKLGPPKFEGGFVMLPVVSQGKWLTEVHNKLSKRCGVVPVVPFRPHVTLGREVMLEQTAEMDTIPNSLQVNVTRMVLAAIQEDDSSKILSESNFRF